MIEHDADIAACAALLQRADPERFRATMAAPPRARRVLFPIHAFNVEVARAPWASEEPMIAEMRLQWWREEIERIAAGERPRRHEVLTPLAGVLAPDAAASLGALIAARRWDIYRAPFEDAAHFGRYIDDTTGTLLVAAAQSLGPADEAVVRDFAHGVGVANWLRAVPVLEGRGRIPLPDKSESAIAELAAAALERLARARRARARVSRRAAPALLAGWQAGAILRQARAEPGRVAAGRLGSSEARARLRLMLRAVGGRW